MIKLMAQDWDYEPLTNDAMFHLVFLNNEKARNALISVLLDIPEGEIVESVVLNPYQHSDAIDAKLTVLDLKIHLKNGKYLNIEMQVRRDKVWVNRTVVYTCRQVTEQTNIDGFEYDKLEPVIHIAIMSHTLFRNHKRFFAKYELKDEEGYRYTDKLQYFVMDLTAAARASESERKRGLVEWAKAFKAKNWEQIQQIDNSGVKEAANQMQKIMSSAEEREIIWRRKMAQMDYDSMVSSERRKGERKGERKGKKEGKKEGEKIGKLKLLKSLIDDGIVTLTDAAKRMNMSADEFKKSVESIGNK